MPVGATGGELRFLDPAVIARIGSIELKARTIVEGFLAGLHRSPFKGFSVEFAEYRQYLPGDDLSTIDWKVYARSDRHYVKKFEEETNVDCHVLLDVSGSMGYGSTGVTKAEYGSYLAAALAYLMNRQRDAVGFMAFDDDIVTHLGASARPGHLRSVLLELDRVKLGSRSNVAKPLHQLADALVKRGIVVLLSDLLDEPEQVIQGLRHLRFRGADVVVFHLLDHDELTFPFERVTRFRDLETADEVLAAPLEIRDHYLREINTLVSRYERELRLVGVDYHLVDTSKPLDFALMSYLSTRSRHQ
ncbi:MAG: DUF58 domain-containing protein [Vicinamibacterales bacterium]|jgi:uncharacterized protein (DUF58 family)|nr:DUF58 domain-containing protein [Acidobacteriota bacterium]MDP6372942.1 DUF58 domain-containing protein [Vicinamibacterales bacterium]MDP6609760.1 DUF58 domain-containing protein [Vicinamibacterales bacterium]HAK54500.1 DUF58 domain-containing protein [Acidobacteriota bacterium]|tara:strand:- start:1207 stop:2115 length:909 start_codon:yes stop_codon:yes gene_type:complete